MKGKRHPRDLISGPGPMPDPGADQRAELQRDAGIMGEVSAYLLAEMERAQRQGKAPEEVLAKLPPIYQAFIGQIAANLNMVETDNDGKQVLDTQGKPKIIILRPTDLQRLAGALRSIDSIMAGWSRLGVDAAKAAAILVSRGAVEDGVPRAITYPFRPPGAPPRDNDVSDD